MRTPLGEMINISVRVIITKSVFQENDKYYPQIHLKDCFFFNMNRKIKIILTTFVEIFMID